MVQSLYKLKLDVVYLFRQGDKLLLLLISDFLTVNNKKSLTFVLSEIKKLFVYCSQTILDQNWMNGGGPEK